MHVWMSQVKVSGAGVVGEWSLQYVLAELMEKMEQMVQMLNLSINKPLYPHLRPNPKHPKKWTMYLWGGRIILKELILPIYMNGSAYDIKLLAYGENFHLLLFGLNGERKVWMEMGMNIFTRELLRLHLPLVLLKYHKPMILYRWVGG